MRQLYYYNLKGHACFRTSLLDGLKWFEPNENGTFGSTEMNNLTRNINDDIFTENVLTPRSFCFLFYIHYKYGTHFLLPWSLKGRHGSS